MFIFRLIFFSHEDTGLFKGHPAGFLLLEMEVHLCCTSFPDQFNNIVLLYPAARHDDDPVLCP